MNCNCDCFDKNEKKCMIGLHLSFETDDCEYNTKYLDIKLLKKELLTYQDVYRKKIIDIEKVLNESNSKINILKMHLKVKNEIIKII